MPSIRRLADSSNTLNSMLLLLKDLRKAVKSLPAWIAPPGAEKFRRLSLLKIRHPSNTVLHDPSSRSPRRTRRSRCLRSKSDSPARGPRPEPASRPRAADEALARQRFRWRIGLELDSQHQLAKRAQCRQPWSDPHCSPLQNNG